MKLRGKLNHDWYQCEDKDAVVAKLNSQVNGKPIYYKSDYTRKPIGIAKVIDGEIEFNIIKSDINKNIIEEMSYNSFCFEMAPSFIYDFEGNNTDKWLKNCIKLQSITFTNVRHEEGEQITCPLCIILEDKNE